MRKTITVSAVPNKKPPWPVAAGVRMVKSCRRKNIVYLNEPFCGRVIYNLSKRGSFFMYKFILPILMLTISNVFMTFAWYGHLKFKTSALWLVILASWGIAFFEYCFQVPANRIGHEVYNAVQLKTIQEVITLIVFSGFSIWYLKEDFRWNYLIGFVFIVLAVLFIFKK